MTIWKSTYISAVVHSSTEDPMLAELATRVHIIDEGAGAFVEIEDGDGNKLRFDPDELYLIAETAQKMLCDIDDKPSIPTDDRLHKAARDLLAVIHRDGGHYTEKVGFVQSCKDAIDVISCDRINASCYINKPCEWTTDKPKSIGHYWCKLDRNEPASGVAMADVSVWNEGGPKRVKLKDWGINTSWGLNDPKLDGALWFGPIVAPDLPV